MGHLAGKDTKGTPMRFTDFHGSSAGGRNINIPPAAGQRNGEFQDRRRGGAPITSWETFDITTGTYEFEVHTAKLIAPHDEVMAKIEAAMAMVEISEAEQSNALRLADKLDRAIAQCATQGRQSNAAQFCATASQVTQHISIDMTGLVPEGAGDESYLNHQEDLPVADDIVDGAVPFDIDMPVALPGTEPNATLMKIAKLLFAMGFMTLLMAVATALYKPPTGVIFERYKLAYYLTLAAISIAGMFEVSTAYLLRSCGLRLWFARAILFASVAPFVLVVALGGFSVLMKT